MYFMGVRLVMDMPQPTGDRTATRQLYIYVVIVTSNALFKKASSEKETTYRIVKSTLL